MSAEVPQEAAEPPPAEPKAIRACLPPTVAAEFDRAWNVTMDQAKQEQSLAPVQLLLRIWQGYAYQELQHPGSYERMLVTMERIRAGESPGPESAERVDALIRRRLGL